MVSALILFSLYQNAVLFSLWRLTPVSQWQHLLTGHWGEVVSVSLLGNFTDHPQGKTHLRMITDNDIEMFTLLLWKMMTHVDTFLGSENTGFSWKCASMKVCCVCKHAHLPVWAHTCAFVLFHLLYIVCSHCFLAPVTGNASLMSLSAGRTSSPHSCLVKSTMPTGSVNWCLDLVPKFALTWWVVFYDRPDFWAEL